MIGYYNYSVILTYVGLGCSVFGMICSFQGGEQNLMIAVLCLALAGACDCFDGKIARAMKNRSHEAELFGVQIDSLCDCVCFGVFPAVLAYHLGMNDLLGKTIVVLFVLCAVIRLAFFNVQEELKRENPAQTNERKTFRGLPVTSISIIFPLLFLLRSFLNKAQPQLFITILTFAMLAVAFFYILDIKIHKPTNSQIIVYIVFVAIVMIKILTLYL